MEWLEGGSGAWPCMAVAWHDMTCTGGRPTAHIRDTVVHSVVRIVVGSGSGSGSGSPQRLAAQNLIATVASVEGIHSVLLHPATQSGVRGIRSSVGAVRGSQAAVRMVCEGQGSIRS